MVSFAAPFAAAFAFAYFVAGWNLQAAEIAGVSLSTTSVAVVYAVMIETGLADKEIGKLILAACFVTDLGTVLALGLLFADFSPLLLLFVAATGVVLFFLPSWTRWFLTSVPNRVSEPEIKFIFLILLLLGGLATAAKSEAVLPAYLVGLAVAGVLASVCTQRHALRPRRKACSNRDWLRCKARMVSGAGSAICPPPWIRALSRHCAPSTAAMLS